MKSGRILGAPDRAAAAPRTSTDAGWRALGWFGLVLTVAGLVDFVLVFYPARLGDPSWEFGVVDAAVSTMPLLVVGVAATLAAALNRGSIAGTRLVAVFALLMAAVILAAYVLFLTNVPVAIRMAPPEVKAGIYKSIVRTTVMCTTFGIGFLVAAIAALRFTSSARRGRVE